MSDVSPVDVLDANKTRSRAAGNKAYRLKNAEKIKLQKALKYRENRDEILRKRKEYYEANADKCAVAMKEYRERTKETRQKREREYREANREKRQAQRKEYYWKHREQQLLKAKLSAVARPWRNMLQAAKERAAKKGVPFSLSDAWMRQNWTGRCALTGIEFGNTGKGPSRFSPSVDRIDPAKGYTPDNCRIILNRLNSLKGDDPNDDFMLELARLLVKTYGDQPSS